MLTLINPKGNLLYNLNILLSTNLTKILFHQKYTIRSMCGKNKIIKLNHCFNYYDHKEHRQILYY